MHRINRSDLPKHFHEEVKIIDTFAEVKTSVPKKQSRCRKCKTPLRSTNPYEFCSLCIERKASAIRDFDKVKGSKVSPNANFYKRYNTNETILIRALRALESEVRRSRKSR